MRRISPYSFIAGGRNERRLISYWTVKGATGGGGASGRGQGGGRHDKRKMEDEKRGRQEIKKKFYPVCDDKRLSQSRLIARSSPLRVPPPPFAVAYQLRFVLRLREISSHRTPPCVPRLGPQPRALDPFTTELSQFRHFASVSLSSPKKESAIWHYYRCCV